MIPQIQAAVRDLVARRLARAYLTLSALAALALGEWAVSGFSDRPAFWTLAGVPPAALALLISAWVVVRRGTGTVSVVGRVGWWVVALIPYAYASFVLAVPGLRRVALQGPDAVPVVLGLAYAFLAVRFLGNVVRVAEAGRLATAMATPAPEEGDVAGDLDGAR